MEAGLEIQKLALPARRSTSGTVAANSFWYGLEIAANFASVFFTSIAMARAFGPKQLGYFNFVLWIANIAGSVGALGLPSATRKYMAEHLASGAGGVARTIFFRTLRLQLLITSLLAAAGVFVVLEWSDPQYRLMPALLVLTLIPRMLTLVPSLANVAAENLRANAPGAVAGIFIYVAAVTMSLQYGWGLSGIAAGMLVSTSAEFFIKVAMTLRWVRRLPRGIPIPAEVNRRMFRYSAQAILLMLIDLVVWNRSDIFFLKLLDKDIRQITFFSLAFNLSEKVALLPDTLGSAMGASAMAQYTRSKAGVRNMLSTAAAYMLLFALPLLLGLAAVSRPLVGTLYGTRYLPAVPVLAIAALFAIPKALRHPVEELLQAAEEQRFIILWLCVCGLLNIGLDFLLIPGHGAAGAAVANGTAQSCAVLGTWLRAGWIFGFPFSHRGVLKTCASGITMAAAVASLSLFLSGWTALVSGVITGCAGYCLMLRFTRALAADDRERLLRARASAPARLRGYFDQLIDIVAPLRTRARGEMPACPDA